MNYSTAILLIDPSVRAVSVSYEIDANGKGKAPFYKFKTVDRTIDPGDYVNIPTDTRHGMTAARVEEVDVAVDFESSEQLKWVVGKVDRTGFDAILKREADVIASIRSAEDRARREELAKKLLADNPALAGFSLGDAAALPAPPAE
jgi:hypothetical protein